MKVVNIRLSAIEEVRNFVNIVSRFDGEVDLKSGRYVVDAKSIMGIFSLDLSKPLELRIISDEENVIADVLDKIGRFIVSE